MQTNAYLESKWSSILRKLLKKWQKDLLDRSQLIECIQSESPHLQAAISLTKGVLPPTISQWGIFIVFFWDGVLLCHPGWSAVAPSQLTAVPASASQVAGITGVCHHAWLVFSTFSRDGTSRRWPGWSWTLDLRWSARLGLPVLGLQTWATVSSL